MSEVGGRSVEFWSISVSLLKSKILWILYTFMTQALVNRRVLRWARQRADLSVDKLAKKVGIKPNSVESWEGDGKLPTFNQAIKIAAATHIPFGYLYLDNLPDEKLDIPDLRSLGSGPPEPLNADTKDLISDTIYKHDWFKEYISENGGEELPFVGKFREGVDVNVVARDIRSSLQMDALAARSPNWEEYLRQIMIRAESIGIWVMRSGIVGNNTRRPLLVSQFRGFAIADKIVPLIFINGKDFKAAQIFTLAHELAHIWFGHSGVSNVPVVDLDIDFSNPVEIACNAIAAEVLVPTDQFRRLWNRNQTFEQNVANLSVHFKVSRIVIARRALNYRFIDQGSYQDFATAERVRLQNQEARIKEAGGDHYLTQAVRYGRRFVHAVATEAARGQLLLREAGRLLNVRPATVIRTYKQIRET